MYLYVFVRICSYLCVVVLFTLGQKMCFLEKVKGQFYAQRCALIGGCIRQRLKGSENMWAARNKLIPRRFSQISWRGAHQAHRASARRCRLVQARKHGRDLAFHSAKPHAGFTFTRRHWQRQSSRRIRPNNRRSVAWLPPLGGRSSA